VHTSSTMLRRALSLAVSEQEWRADQA
jgi:hypothetical protein